MQFSFRVHAVFPGCENDDPSVAGELDTWETPTIQVIRVVRQKPTVQVDHFVAVVQDLDPIRSVAILVSDPIVV